MFRFLYQEKIFTATSSSTNDVKAFVINEKCLDVYFWLRGYLMHYVSFQRYIHVAPSHCAWVERTNERTNASYAKRDNQINKCTFFLSTVSRERRTTQKRSSLVVDPLLQLSSKRLPTIIKQFSRDENSRRKNKKQIDLISPLILFKVDVIVFVVIYLRSLVYSRGRRIGDWRERSIKRVT